MNDEEAEQHPQRAGINLISYEISHLLPYLTTSFAFLSYRMSDEEEGRHLLRAGVKLIF